MELPAKVIVFSPCLEIKNQPAVLVSVSPQGFYELTMEFSGRRHSVLAPVAQTGLIFNEPKSEFESLDGIER
jgi:hypothetical protein